METAFSGAQQPTDVSTPSWFQGHLHGALARSVPPRTLLASGAAAMALSAAASFLLSALAPLLALLFVPASTSFLPRARAPAPTSAPPFPERSKHCLFACSAGLCGLKM